LLPCDVYIRAAMPLGEMEDDVVAEELSHGSFLIASLCSEINVKNYSLYTC